MTSVYLDLEDVHTPVSDYMFEKIPIKQFDQREVSESAAAALNPVLNARTDWDNIPLRGDLCKVIAEKFMAPSVTDAGAQVFVDVAALSPEQMTGLFNLVVEAVQPTWATDPAGSPLPQLDFDLAYSIVEERTKFSLESDARFCQFMKVFMHKNLAKAIFILYEEDISPEAKAVRIAADIAATGPAPAPAPAPGPAGTMVHRVQLDEKVSGPDRALAAQHDEISPDRVQSALDDPATAKLLSDSFSSRSSKGVKDRLKELKPDYIGGPGLDIDGNLAHANLFRMISTNSLYGKGELAQELRELSASRSRTIAEKYFLKKVKIGTPLAVRVAKFGIELGKFKFGTYSQSNDVMDMIMGTDPVSGNCLPVTTEHDLKFVVKTMTAIYDELWIHMVDFEDTLLTICTDLQIDHRVSIAVIYKDVVKTVFRLFANLMDDRTGWFSVNELVPCPRPKQLIAALKKADIDKGLPDATQNAATQMIKAINDAAKTGAVNGHLDTAAYDAQLQIAVSEQKRADQNMQKMMRRVQQLERRGSADAGDAGADEPQPDLEFGAKRTRQASGIDGKFSGIDGKIVPSKQVSFGGLPPGITTGLSDSGNVKSRPMRAIGILTGEFVTAWRDMCIDRSVMPKGPNRCIFYDIGQVPGYETWNLKCAQITKEEHANRKWHHGGDKNPRPDADGQNSRVPGVAVSHLKALLVQHGVPLTP